MEDSPKQPVRGILVRAAAKFIAGLRIAQEQLAGADLNPHEGRLRASIMPAKYMNIPDFPPESPDKF